MKELEEEISRLIQQIKYLRSEIDEIKGDSAENNSLLKKIFSLLNSRH